MMDKATQATHCHAEDASLRRPSLPIVISRNCSDRTGECVEEKPRTHACKERNSAQSPTVHGGKPRNGNANANASTSTSRAGQAGGRPSGEARAVANRHRASRTAPRPCWWHQMYIESNQEEANRVTYSTYSPTGTASPDAVTGLSHYKPREAITPSRRRAQAPPASPINGSPTVRGAGYRCAHLRYARCSVRSASDWLAARPEKCCVSCLRRRHPLRGRLR